MFDTVVLRVFSDGVFWIWIYDREGCIQTSGIDFTQDLPRLAVLLFALQRFQLKHWGFHPDLDVLAQKIHRGLAATDTEPALSMNDLENLQQFVTESSPKASSTSPSTLKLAATLALSDGKSVKVDFRSLSPIHRRHGLCGRATQVLAISEIHTNDSLVGPEKFVLKAYWPDLARLSEQEIIASALDTCPDVADHLPYIFGSRDDTDFSTDRIRTALGVQSMSRGHRVLRLIVFEELYRVQDQRSSELAMTTVLEAVQCHYTLWVKGIHHTDISLDNIMVRQRRALGNDTPRLSGVVNDWDLASTSNSRHANLERTGTIPFMHPELLTDAYWQGNVPRLYIHDNASFIWVMAFLFLRYNKGKIIESPTLPLDELITNNYEAARRIKSDIKQMLPSFKPGPDAKKEWALVVRLLLWTGTSNDQRADARVVASDDPIELAKLLNADDAADIYKQFWGILADRAAALRLDYITSMVPERILGERGEPN
ncbi:hypothetical protein C8J57DRAFT_1101423 [Mycena rebaudengoi]|nr:hypothetical protein C8J57DRAFT_1101423 [Mycena rebaudengoi]